MSRSLQPLDPSPPPAGASALARTLALALAVALPLAACQRGGAPAATAPTAAPSSASTGTAAKREKDAPSPQPAILPLATFDTAWTIIARSHWDSTYNGVDWAALRDTLRPKAAAAASQQELRQVLQSMVLALHQSHFAIIPREVSGAAVGETQDPDDSREGQVGLTTRWLDNALVVTGVEAGSPAERAGVRPGWLITRVGEDTIPGMLRSLPSALDPRRVSLAAYSLSESALSGTPGSTLTVSFADEQDRPRDLTLTRIPVRGTPVTFGNLPTQHAYLDWSRHEVDGKRVGVIHFNIWMPILGREFDVAMDSLRDSDAIVLDIRGNFGGVAGMAMGFAGHFVDTVIPVGVMKTRTQTMKFAINPRRVNTANERVTPFAGPLAIVVDELSISTSEIFAGGLQDLSRARIIGRQSAGQALPAVAERLPNGDILYHAIADFLSPSGGRMEGDGVIPDEAVRLTREALLAKRDPALEAALQWAAHAPPPGPVTGTRITP